MASRKKSPKSTGSSEPATSTMAGPRELIVIAEESAGLYAAPRAMESTTGGQVSSLNETLAQYNATMVPVFGTEERVRYSIARARAPMPAGAPDPATFYQVVAEDDQLDELAEQLRTDPNVAGAYVKPGMEPPVFIEESDKAAPALQAAPPVTPSFASRQLYLNPAPGGIDAQYAWTKPGGKGQGIRIIDIEGAWRFTHEDLIQNQGGVIGGTPSSSLGWRNHGTAVVGEFSGDENSFGITGICPQANVRAISIFGSGQSSAKAITDAANALSPGDIILIELHAPGPRHNYQQRNDQLGYIAVEFWPADFAAIVYATSVRGVIVVEAAGNGAENLDDSLYNTRPTGFPTTWKNPFNLANPQSGAILVGAGAPPPGTHGRDHGPDRSRLGFSNYGSRVDVQGWGREVTTAAYGDLQNGSNEDFWYTDIFSGTSSASPIVVGALGCMQGGLKAKSKTLLTPSTALNTLRNTGSPQQDAPGRPASQRIGNRPNLKQAFQQLGLEPIVIKKLETKELKERLKIELKEIEKYKELEKYKEIEKVKDWQEVMRPQEGLSRSSSAELESRVALLEQALIQISHFISAEQRPDLQTSALNQEADLQALSQQLEKQANDAKAAKDDKDVEKLREV